MPGLKFRDCLSLVNAAGVTVWKHGHSWRWMPAEALARPSGPDMVSDPVGPFPTMEAAARDAVSALGLRSR
jgi:hypothetical protein